ncbi:MAG TPA: hypothetical protein VMB03_03595 [Bryobacteraceae bacterium]|nr:hypothetical protein [Bryobacteraceae bacterium]
MKKWTAVEYDLTKKLIEGAQPKRVELKPGMKLELIIELDDKVYARLAKDNVWIHRMQEKANEKAKPAIEAAVQLVKKTDEKAQNFDEKTANIFSKDLESAIKSKMETAGTEMAKEVDKLFEEYKKGQKDLSTFRIKSAGKITLNVISIGGHIAVAAASHGAHVPLAIIGIIRNANAIGQECIKLFLNADQFAKIIQGEIKVLETFMQKNLDTTRQKVSQSIKEIGLNLISGALGIETPSLKNCEEHIKVHYIDIQKLEKESHQLGQTVNAALDKEREWHNKVQEAIKKGKNSKEIGKIVLKRESAEKALDKLLNSIFKINEGINRAKERQDLFEKTLKAMKDGVPAWTGYAKTVGSLAIDIGLSMGDVKEALETAVEVIGELEKTTAEVVIEMD